jgi:radical SAM superfamily enzyme YgiQ (UPF0313 family)
MKVLLISPPFVQLNSPYSSLPYLKGVLEANGTDCSCLDLGIKVANRLFSKSGLEKLSADLAGRKDIGDAVFFEAHKEDYLKSVGPVVSFLKGKNPLFEETLLDKRSLPRYKMSLSALERKNSPRPEYARYLASLYLEDIFLFYKALCPDYGLSRYAESIAVSPPSFDPVLRAVLSDDLISRIIGEEIEAYDVSSFGMIAFTIPFPGTLAGALKAAKFIREKYPDKVIVLGGGYINTELRSLKDPRIFEFTDFICTDDGEEPLLKLISHVETNTGHDGLVRTYYSENGKVAFAEGAGTDSEFKRGTPDYSDINFTDYIPVIETLNPMMKLWSEKDTLKLRLARGCYWHKCEFCDTSLPYIKKYSPEQIDDLISDIKAMTAQTGLDTFHFTDEAIPPSLAVRLSVALLKENLRIKWWGNFRFDPAFTDDVCLLLARAGCIAAVGGLESCSDKTLKSMNKGIKIEDAVRTIKNFRSAGILTHAYMIYGFPGETWQDLIDSFEVLRQLFARKLLDSAYWHRFALTRHSGVFRGQKRFNITVPDNELKPFANNDIAYLDNSRENIDEFSAGLKKAVYNWMHGSGADMPAGSWFSFPVPKPKVVKNFVKNIIEDNRFTVLPDHKLIWTGGSSEARGKIIKINGADGLLEYELPGSLSSWLAGVIGGADIKTGNGLPFDATAASFPKDCRITFSDLMNNEIWDELRTAGLLIIRL